MSLADAAVRSTTLAEDVQAFEARLRNTRSARDPRARESGMRDLEAFAARIQGRLQRERNPAAESDFQRLWGEYRALQVQPAPEPLPSGAQSSGREYVDQEQVDGEADVDFLAEQTRRIVGEMREVQELAVEIDQRVRSDHARLVQIDATVEDAKEEVAVGNRELVEAEGGQKTSTKCLVFIGVVIALALIVVIVIVVVATKKKKK